MSQIVSQSKTASRIPLNKYGYNCIGKHIGMALVVCIPLFIGAGTLDWVWAWGFSAATLVGWLALSLVLARFNPELLNERGKRAKQLPGTMGWDWLILGAYSILLLVTPLVAGLDYRYTWSSPVADGVKIIGLAILGIGFWLLTWSMMVNRFFEATVRIQTTRNHRTISSGPYRYVRHPGYVGVMLQFIAVPLSLGSWAAWLPALLGVALYILRTGLEDRALTAELPGYADYARQTRYRLFPGIW
jgi:protein-S-isoprenylcysteine O-methyltransferase Ste14